MLIHLKSSFPDSMPNKFTLIVGPRTKGLIYWKTIDICRALKMRTIKPITRRFMSHMKRFLDVTERYKRTKTHVMSTEDVYEVLEHLSPRIRNKDFEKWFENINSGYIKLMAEDRQSFYKSFKCIHESNRSDGKSTYLKTPEYKYDRYLGEYEPVFVKEYMHQPQFRIDQDGIEYEKEESKLLLSYAFTLPELVTMIKYIPMQNEKKVEENNAASQMDHFFENALVIDEDAFENTDGAGKENGATTNISHTPNPSLKTHVEADEMMALVNQDKCFNFFERMTGKNYKFVALDLNWDSDSIRPINLFPYNWYDKDLKKNFLYIPMEVNGEK